MRNGYKVFDADSHVIYPADLWQTYLDPKFRDRVTRRSPAGLDTYNPVEVDGRWTQHDTSLYGQFQKAIGWTAEDMVEQYGDIVTEGFTGDRVAAAHAVDGIDVAVIYGPEYDAPEHLARLRKRGLSAKRSLALRELALGLEALERFVRHEPLRRVHECVFGVLALESEPVDPRL